MNTAGSVAKTASRLGERPFRGQMWGRGRDAAWARRGAKANTVANPIGCQAGAVRWVRRGISSETILARETTRVT